MSVPDSGPAQHALLLVAVEWWKTSRRLLRLAADAAPGRLERERAQATYAARRIEAALDEAGLRLLDHTGEAYSPALPAEPVNPEDVVDVAEEELDVADTVEPTVMHRGRVARRGKVVLCRRAATPLSTLAAAPATLRKG